MKVQICNTSENKNPQYSNPTDAGADLRADFSKVTPENPISVFGDAEIIFKGENHNVTMLRLEPGTRALIPTGIYTSIPEGYEVQIRPRSGMAIKRGLSVINTPGTIDSSYKGQWFIPVINLGHESVWIEDSERIAQAVLNKFEKIEWVDVNRISELFGEDRGGGIGHSGSK